VIYLVDTVRVDEGNLAAYIGLLASTVRPSMERAGAVFERCRTSGLGLGQPVDIELTWSFADFAVWNHIRRSLVVDPAWYQCSLSLAAMRLSGTRRFYDEVRA